MKQKNGYEMHQRKLIILLDQPLDDRNLERFGIDFYINNNWQVQFWNFINITNKKKNSDYKKLNIENKKNLQVHEFNNFFFYLFKVFNIKNSFYYVNFSSDRFVMTLIQYLFYLKNGKKVHISVGTIPEEKMQYNRINKILNLLSSFKIIRIMSIVLGSLSRKLLSPKIDFAFISGKQEIHSINRKHDTKIFFSHNLDYDIYLKYKSTPKKNNFIVFVDQNVPNHPDWKANNLIPPVTYKRYWDSIKKLLQYLSLKYHKEIVISAHPRNKVNDIPITDFKIAYGRTAEIIRDAVFIIGHDSTALQFAVLWNKPILFITTDELEINRQSKINYFSDMYGYKKVINIDKDYDKSDLDKAMRININSYETYVDKYIKIKNSPRIYSWEIINKHLK